MRREGARERRPPGSAYVDRSQEHFDRTRGHGALPIEEQRMIILHHGWRSSASRRVRLCLEEKGLEYEGHVVDMANMEHHSPEYLKINPLGVIPTLIHDGQPLHESGTIC